MEIANIKLIVQRTYTKVHADRFETLKNCTKGMSSTEDFLSGCSVYICVLRRNEQVK